MTEVREATPAGRFIQLLLLATSAWAVVYARFALGPLQEAMRIDLSLGDNQMALLQGTAVAVPLALGAIPLGLLVDRFSRVHLFVFFLTLNLAATVVTAFASTLPLLFAARCVAGLALAGVVVAAYSMVADLYAPAQRGRATMVVALGDLGGPPSAFAVGGVLLAMAGSGSDSWRSALLWMSVPLVLTVLLMPALREPPRTEVIVKKSPLREVGPALWRYRSVVVPLVIARIMVWIADGAVLVWGAPTFARTFALPPERIGAIMATVLLIGGLAGPILGGPLADLCQRTGGPRRTMTALCGLAILSGPVALFAVMPNVTLASVMLAVFLSLGFTINVVALALAIVVIPGELRGLFIAVTLTAASSFSFGVAPLMVSGLSGALGGPAMIGQALAVVCGVTSIAGAIVFGFGSRYFSPQSAKASLALLCR